MVKEKIMKRYKSILLFLFSILACQNEINQNENTNENAIPMSFYAGIEIPKDSSLTKTVLAGSPADAFRNVLWEYQDEVYVTNGSQSAKFINTSQGTSEIALLEGQLAEGANYFAAYPYDMVNGYSSSGFTIELPSVQSYCKDGVASGSFPMVAQCEEGIFNFKNICGIFVVQLLGEKEILSITFSGKDSYGNDIPVAGQGKVTMSYSDVPSMKMNSSSSTQVTLSCPESVSLDESTPTAFHIILPSGIYDTFDLIIKADDGAEMIVSSNKSLTIRRSTRTTAAAFEFTSYDGDATYYIDEYGINHGPGVKIGGVVWAPVNCGYHETDYPWGKLYQWGRRYGQGYSGSLYDVNGKNIGEISDATVPVIEEGGVSVATGNHENNENVFYLGMYSYNYDWVYPQDSKLWNIGTESDPVKTEYDPCPEGWRVPTYAELDELSNNKSSWTTNDKQQPGYWFSGSSSYKSSVPQVFFPSAGLRYYDDDALNRGYSGNYWSSQPDVYRTYSLGFNGSLVLMNGYSRAEGLSVRCVQDDGELIPVSSLTLSSASISMNVNETITLSATLSPSNANHKAANWWSDDPSVATVDQSGKVTAVSAGTATITAMAGMRTATCTVTVNEQATSEPQEVEYIDEYGINHGPGVEIDGVVWAPVNCGYHETDYPWGKLYQWGRRYGQGYSGSQYDVNGNNIGDISDATVPVMEDGGVSVVVGNNKNNENVFYLGMSSYHYDWVYPQDSKLWNIGTESDPVKTEYDPCPDGWRVPTYAELDELRKKKSSWTTDDKQQPGYWFSGTSSYTSSVPQVFFPAAGRRYDGDYDGDGNAYGRGDRGRYWSSRPSYSDANYLFFYDGFTYMISTSRANGYSVRCVQITDEVADL